MSTWTTLVLGNGQLASRRGSAQLADVPVSSGRRREAALRDTSAWQAVMRSTAFQGICEPQRR